MKVEPENRLSS